MLKATIVATAFCGSLLTGCFTSNDLDRIANEAVSEQLSETKRAHAGDQWSNILGMQMPKELTPSAKSDEEETWLYPEGYDAKKVILKIGSHLAGLGYWSCDDDSALYTFWGNGDRRVLAGWVDSIGADGGEVKIRTQGDTC